MQTHQERPRSVAGPARIARAETFGAGELVLRLVKVAGHGLVSAIDPETGEFAWTMRRQSGPPASVAREGTSLRYAAIAALGIARLRPVEQSIVLGGTTIEQLCRSIGAAAVRQTDPGAMALAAWAAAEAGGAVDPALLVRMDAALQGDRPIPTVDLAWIVTAAVASGAHDEIGARATSRLLTAQGPQGLFPHAVPATSMSRWRRHVGSFADQVYPLQALARMSRATNDPRLLSAAERTAARLCELQGPDGQWWWHYDARTGDVVERFPVYSVHQHAMAPMVLFDLAEAGGTDRTVEIVRGLRWIENHPEARAELVDPALGAIWRKVGRREPGKAARALSAAVTSVRPGARVPGVDRLLPVGQVDHECRPYELGWLLYAWLPQREVTVHD